jgi:hypothetical protein
MEENGGNAVFRRGKSLIFLLSLHPRTLFLPQTQALVKMPSSTLKNVNAGLSSMGFQEWADSGAQAQGL